MVAILRLRLLLPALLGLAASSASDVLVLKDGKTIEGEVAPKDGAYEVKTKFGTLSVDKADVVKIVAGPDAMAAEAGTLRATARSMIDAAASVSDPALQSRKLGAAVEILEKALEIVTEARAIFKGDAHAHLDKTAAELMREIRETRDRIPAGSSSPAAPPPHAPKPPAPTPAPTPAGEPLGGDLLAPPSPPSALSVIQPPQRVENAQEGENLKILACTGGQARPQNRAPLWRGPWSGDAQLWWTGGGPGDTLTLRFRSDEAGPKTLVLGLIKSFDYAIITVAVNGRPAAAAIDCFAPEVVPSSVELPVELEEGHNELTLRITGANPASRGTMVGLDYVAVRPADPGALAAGAVPAVPAIDDSPAGKLLAEAKDLAGRKRPADAIKSLERLFKEHPGTPAAAAALPLFNELPHPDGRLVCGFDTPKDLAAWSVYRRRLLTFELVADPKQVKEGTGAARATAARDVDHTTGALVLQMETFDESRFRGVSIWIFQAQPSPGRLELAFIRGKQEALPWISEDGDSELGACLYWATPLNFVGWRKFKIAATQFQQRGAGGVSGKIAWRDVGALVIYDAARKGMDVVLDSLRFIESEH